MAAPRLKRTTSFLAVYRRGRWIHGPSLSIGFLASQAGCSRIGLRTKRGMKGAVVRNRLKRQLRALVHASPTLFRPGLDVIVVIHPRIARPKAATLGQELASLCKKAGLLSPPA